MATKAKTKTTKTAKSAGSRLEGTILEQPFAVANKAFLASIGLADQVVTGFGEKFDEFAADGEKVRDRAKKSTDEIAREAGSSFDSFQKNAKKRADQLVESILSMSPVATSSDVHALNAKLDKVLAEVAK
jgi:polyhydroxyalkanoate synthesis regulator phasin